MGEGAARAVRGYRLFECPGKARPARSSHVKQLFVWGSQSWGQGLGKGPKPLASFLFPRKGEGCRGLLGVRTPPPTNSPTPVPSQAFYVGVDGVLPSRRGWAWDPSTHTHTPLARLWERTEHKGKGWPSELGDRAALVQGRPELGGSSTGTPSPQGCRQELPTCYLVARVFLLLEVDLPCLSAGDGVGTGF